MPIPPSRTGTEPPDLGEAERVATAAAPADLQAGYRAFLAFDGLLGRIALSAREPLPAQLRLAWWRDACADIGRAQVDTRHPVLVALAQSWSAGSSDLGGLVDGWEEIVVRERGFAAAAEALARHRADALAVIARKSSATTIAAARVWTLVTLAEHAPEASEREAMRRAASRVTIGRLPRSLRPLAVLAGLSRRALAADRGALLGDRMSPLAAMRLGIFGR